MPARPRTGRRAQRRAAQEAAREAEQARSMRRLRRFVLPAGGAALVLVLLVAFLVNRGGGSDPGTAAAPSRGQETLLIQLVPAAGEPTSGNALTGSSTTADSAVFAAIPGRLITDAPGRGRTTLAQTATGAEVSAGAQALADQLDIVVDGAWVTTEAGLAALVDAVGGVRVDVDVEVTARSGGSTVVAVPSGAGQTLDGAGAVRFATFRGPDETEQAQLARFTVVWTDVLRRLPGDAAAMQAQLAVVPGSVSTLAPERLADYLVGLHRAVVADSMAYPTLPTAVVDTGSGVTTYRLVSDEVPAFVRQSFAGSLPPTPAGGAVTVLVQNGVGTPGLSAQARAKLLDAGLTYEGGGNASRFGYETSVVLISDATERSRQQGAAVAAALGLPASAVQQAEQSQSVADVLVILGADFRGADRTAAP